MSKFVGTIFRKFPVWLILTAIAVISYVVQAISPFTIVNAGHRGVSTTFGAVNQKVLSEGLHLVVPVIERVREVNVQIQRVDAEGDAASKDLQQVTTKVTVNFHLLPDQVATTVQTVGDLDTVGDRIISPAVQEVFKAITAEYTAEELITQRAVVREKINVALSERLSRYGVGLDELSITNFSFSRSFNDAIEAKTTAEQLKLKAERDLERIRVEAEQKVAAAKAEAESLKLQKQEVTAELLRLREIENNRLAIEKWDGKLPTFTGQSGVPLLNLTGSSQ